MSAIPRPPWVLALAAFTAAGCYSPHVPTSDAHVALWRGGEATPPVADADRSGPLDVQRLIALARERNPELETLRSRIAAAAIAAEGPGSFADLELRVTDMRIEEFRARDQAVDLSVRGRPPRPGMPASRVQEAELEVEALRARLATEERRIGADVRALHAAALLALEEQAIADEDAALRATSRALIQRRVDAQLATELDLVLADLERAEVADESSSLALDAHAAEAALRRLLAWPAAAPLALTGPPGGVALDVPADERDVLVERALRGRSELQLAGVRVAEANLGLWRARVSQIPWFRFIDVGYRAGPKLGADAWGFAFGIDLPVYAWTGVDVDAADARVASRHRQHLARVAEIVGEVDAALAAVDRARQRLAAVETNLLPAAAAAREAADRAADQGALDPLRALRLQAAQLRAKRRHLDARRSLVLALIDLDEATAAEP